MKTTIKNKQKTGNNLIKILLMTLFFVCFLNTSFAQNYYVASNGNNSNSGTDIDHPWKTIAKANATLQAGATVFIRQGTYHENIKPVRSGTSSNKITYTNYQNEVVKIVGDSATNQVVKINKAYIVIKGLTLYHEDLPSCSGYGGCAPFRIFIVHIEGPDAHHNEIINNKIISPYALVALDKDVYIREGGVGIRGNTHHNLIKGNEIRNMSFNAIGLNKAPMFTKIINNTVIDYYQDGVHIGQGANTLSNTLIEGNVFAGSVRSDGIQADSSDGTLTKGIIIRNNLIYNNAENNIDLKGTQNIIIEENILHGSIGDNDGGTRLHDRLRVFNDRETQFVISQGGSTESKDVIIRNNIIYDNSGGIGARTVNGSEWIIYNNTIVNNTRDFEGPNSTFTRGNSKPVYNGISTHGASRKNAILNNIVGDSPEGEMAVQGPNVNCDYNFYFNTYKDLKLAHYKTKGNWSLLSFSQWKNRLNIDHNSIVGNPNFVKVPSRPVGNPSQFDFSLQSGSPAIDKGGFLTTATNSGSGTQIKVADARFFYNGFGVTQGDLVQFKGQTQTARVTNVNYSTNTLTVNTSLTWTAGLGISLPYNGSAPDIGTFEFGSTLAVDDAILSDMEITISPNPAVNEITIQSPQVKIEVIKIFDMLGKEVFSKQVETNEGKISIEPNLVNGIYIVKINTDKGMLSKKIILK